MRGLVGMRLWVNLVGAAWVFGLAGCAAGRTGGMTGRELVGIDEAWCAAAATGDVEKIMSYWTEHAVMYAPNLPPLYGKRAIGELIGRRHMQPGYRISWTPCCAGVDERGGMGYTLGEGTVTLADESGELREHYGRYVSIWQTEGDRWRCAVKCWTPSVRSAPSEP